MAQAAGDLTPTGTGARAGEPRQLPTDLHILAVILMAGGFVIAASDALGLGRNDEAPVSPLPNCTYTALGDVGTCLDQRPATTGEGKYLGFGYLELDWPASKLAQIPGFGTTDPRPLPNSTAATQSGD